MAEHIASTDDSRAANSPVRHAYRVLSDDEKRAVAALKDKGAALLAEIETLAEARRSRELSIARTRIEEAVMWAVKHVTA